MPCWNIFIHFEVFKYSKILIIQKRQRFILALHCNVYLTGTIITTCLLVVMQNYNDQSKNWKIITSWNHLLITFDRLHRLVRLHHQWLDFLSPQQEFDKCTFWVFLQLHFNLKKYKKVQFKEIKCIMDVHYTPSVYHSVFNFLSCWNSSSGFWCLWDTAALHRQQQSSRVCFAWQFSLSCSYKCGYFLTTLFPFT